MYDPATRAGDVVFSSGDAAADRVSGVAWARNYAASERDTDDPECSPFYATDAQVRLLGVVVLVLGGHAELVLRLPHFRVGCVRVRLCRMGSITTWLMCVRCRCVLWCCCLLCPS